MLAIAKRLAHFTTDTLDERSTRRDIVVVAPPEEHVRRIVLHKEKRAMLVGLNFATCTTMLPAGFHLDQAVVFSVKPGSSASHANVQSLDVVTEISGIKIRSAEHAICIIHLAIGPIHMKVRPCPARVVDACLRIQRTWRQHKSVERVVLRRHYKTGKYGITFACHVANAAIVTCIDQASILAGSLNVGDAVLFVDGTVSTSPAQAAQRMRDSGPQIVLICKSASYVHPSVLLPVKPAKPADDPAQLESCAICFEDMAAPMPWVAGCGHLFCSRCTQRCRKRSDMCPLCRATPYSRAATHTLLRH